MTEAPLTLTEPYPIALGQTLSPRGFSDDVDTYTMLATELITTRTSLLGTSGSGKSNAMRRMIEGIVAAGYPFVLIDMAGEHGVGLKTLGPVLIASTSDRGDIPLIGIQHAESLATSIVDSHINAVIDLGSFLDAQKREFCATFLTGLYQRCHHYWLEGSPRPRLLAIEETHIIAPQQLGRQKPFSQESKDAVETVASQGRKLGLGLLTATQRPAKINKDVLAMSLWYFLLQARYWADAAVEAEYAGGPKALETIGVESVQKLQVGDAIVSAPIHPIKLIHFFMADTPQGGGTPKDIKPVSPEFTKVIEALKEQISQLTKDDPLATNQVSPLKAEIRRLRDSNRERDQKMRNMSRELDIRREPVEGFDRDKYVPKDLYDSLIQQMDQQKRSLDESKELMESLNETNEALGKRITTLEGLTRTGEISIDQFGNITTKWPWLTKLLDVPATQARIIKVLQEKPGLTAPQLAQRFGMGDDSIRKHLEILVKRRVLTKNYRSYPAEWRLSDN